MNNLLRIQIWYGLLAIFAEKIKLYLKTGDNMSGVCRFQDIFVWVFPVRKSAKEKETLYFQTSLVFQVVYEFAKSHPCYGKLKKNNKQTKKTKTQVILSALCPWLRNSMRSQHTLQMFADHCGPRQTIPWEAINQGLLQPQGELYPFQTIFNHRSRDQLHELLWDY